MTTEAALFVIFGGAGDLSRRKLLPAIAHLGADGHIHEHLRVIAVGLHPLSDDEFRQVVRDALGQAGLGQDAIDSCVGRLYYHDIGEGKTEDYQQLGKRLEALRQEHDIPPNFVFYLSLPPKAFADTAAGLGQAGLNRSDGWSRLVIEKPFGRDLASAQVLNERIHEYFSEEQIYRIDHYLGKETVQNLLVFRLANAFIESSWNRDRIEAVQIMVGEDLGVGTRGAYYDQSGALRDMVQNHLTQLLTLVAMGVPTMFTAEAIRHEKIKVLQSLRPIQQGDVVFGQYSAGEIHGTAIPAYQSTDAVPSDSQTETFAALKLYVDSWRWQGVPFYLRTGKCMPHKTTQIAIRFRPAPVSFFRSLGYDQDTHDVMTITLQPNEGFAFYLDIKMPGSPLRLERIPLSFGYEDHFRTALPDAYQTLLLDVIEGDQTLFVHADEVEASWRTYAPLLAEPPKVHPYAAGTWGPPEAESLAIPEADLWQRR